VSIRPAVPGDLDRILALAAAQREEYAGYQPRFWRPAAGAAEAQRAYLLRLIEDADAVALVSEPSFGYALGRLLPAPPVYERGPACLVVDFAVEERLLWPRVGVELLTAVRAAARDRGATEAVVVTARLDGPKRAALTAAGLVPASEWWVGELD
jgi:GNAT superfamily N-acetyltransferase